MTTDKRNERKGKSIVEILGEEKAEIWRKNLSKSLKLRWKNKGVSELTSKKLSESAKRNGFGGYHKKTGRGRHGQYKGIWCDSSWELAWVIYHLEHEITFNRNCEKFVYEFQGKKHNYIPDFKLTDGTYVEIKGYLDEKSKCKIDSFNHPLNVFMHKEMIPILNYVRNKYGNDFIKLYDKDEDNHLYKTKKISEEAKKINKEKSHQKWLKNQQEKIDLVLSSNIDFTKWGWIGEVSKLIGISYQKVRKWMKKCLPQIQIRPVHIIRPIIYCSKCQKVMTRAKYGMCVSCRLKGKTFKELYGEEKAKEISEKQKERWVKYKRIHPHGVRGSFSW